jgi:dinuclear metal center YbgI/SA1388 family protein
MTAREIIRKIDTEFPPQYALHDDPTGLQIGPFDGEVRQILATLDVTEAVTKKAIETGSDFILAHHPLLFNPLRTIDVATPTGRIISEAIRHRITVYAVHTPADVVGNGLNDYWANLLSLKDIRPIACSHREKLLKIQFFVPASHRDIVREAMFRGGAGAIGNYSDCTFSSVGIGTFRPLAGTNPYIGKLNQLEAVEEVKIETVVPESKVNAMIEMVIEVHPYEEVAFDIFEEISRPKEKGEHGLGRYGNVPPQRFGDFLRTFRNLDGIGQCRSVGNYDDIIEVIGVCTGSGKSLLHSLPDTLDVYITGDLGHHDLLALKERGKKVILVDHYDSEHVFTTLVKTRLEGRVPDIISYCEPVFNER